MTVSRTSRRAVVAPVLALGVGLAVTLGLSACSAGQITQTAVQVAPVPGTDITIGDVALRNLLVTYHGTGGYPVGANAPLEVRIFNTGTTLVRLTGVSSPDAASVTLIGGPAASPLPTTTPPPSPSAAGTATPGATAGPTAGPTATATATAVPTPTGPAGQTQFSIDIQPQSYVLLVAGSGPYLQLNGLTKALMPGVSTPVKFTFDGGAPIEVLIPLAPPSTSVPRATPEIEEAEGH